MVDTLRRSSDNTGYVDPMARLYRAFLQRIPDREGSSSGSLAAAPALGASRGC
ncbi:MAG: hypothetical protein R2702_06505 [Acidimicrobiales bacterium]